MPNEAQNLTVLSYTDWTGGMNSAVPPTSLQDNEYQLIRNFEFNFNKLTTRGGLSAPLVTFPSTINGVFYHEATGEKLVVLKNKDVYRVNAGWEASKVGEVNGTSKPSFCSFDGRIFIATGGKLQYYDYTNKNITTIATSYDCDSVFERFGRVVTSIRGSDNMYYSAVGNPYESKTVEVEITDANGNKTSTTTTSMGETGTSTNEVVVQSTSNKTTTITDKVTVVKNSVVANTLDGTNPSAGTTTTNSQQHVVKIVEGYKGSELVSTVYYLDDVQSDKDKCSNLTYNDIVFGTVPSLSTYLPVQDKDDALYGAVYRDVAGSSNAVTRTYYFDADYDAFGSKLIVTYKLDRVKNSSGTITSSKLSVPYLRISLGEIPEEAFDEELEIINNGTTKANITNGTSETTKSTVARLTSTDTGATAKFYYKTRVVSNVTTSTSNTTTTTTALVDDKGYKIGDRYTGITNKTIVSEVSNSDGSVTKYETTVNKRGNVSNVARTISEIVKTSSTSGVNYTETSVKTSVNVSDNGSNTITTTTTNTVTDANTYTLQGNIFTLTLGTTTTVATSTVTNSTKTKATYDSGWTDDSNDDSSGKWLEIGYKDDGDILKVVPIGGDIAVFKTNGRVYSVSNEYPNWTVQQIAEHTDVLDANAIVPVGSDIAFLTNKGLKTLKTTAMYGNFTTDEIARKINKSVMEKVVNPKVFNIVRKRQLIIVPNTSNNGTARTCYVYQYDIGAGMMMDFAFPIYDMQDTPNGVIIASVQSLYMWSFDYSTDNGRPIKQEIVSKKYATSNRLYTRMVDIGVEGEAGRLVTMKWANKTVNYAIPEKRRMINVFSVCRDSVFGLYTTAKISLEYIKLYIFEQ